MCPFPPPGTFDLHDLLVEQVQGIVEIANHRHTLGQTCIEKRAADLAARRVPKRQAGLEPGNAFGGFCFQDECNAKGHSGQRRR